MKYFVRHSAILLLLAAISCQKEDTCKISMSFGTDDEIYTWTKADALKDAIGISSMKVWTSRIENTRVSTLMAGYEVNYTDAEGWRYDNVANQSLQYWDMNANAFRFHAAAPASAVSEMTASSTTLSLTATDDLSNTALFSAPIVVNDQSEFGNTVSLSFNHGYSCVSVAFINSSMSDITISELKLTPATNYISSAKLNVNYNWDASPISLAMSISEPSTLNTALGFSVSSEIKSGTTDAVRSDTKWYMVPESVSSESSEAQWTISFKDNGTLKSTTFGQGKKWRPGYSYTYTFTLKDDGIYLLGGVIETIDDGDTSDWLSNN